jgi:cell division protein FtsW (lipid II flippase)
LRKHFSKISFAFLILTFGFYFMVPTNNNYSSTTINTWLLIGLALTLIFAFLSPKNAWKKIVLTVIAIAIVIFLFIAIAFGISGL